MVRTFLPRKCRITSDSVRMHQAPGTRTSISSSTTTQQPFSRTLHSGTAGTVNLCLCLDADGSAIALAPLSIFEPRSCMQKAGLSVAAVFRSTRRKKARQHSTVSWLRRKSPKFLHSDRLSYFLSLSYSLPSERVAVDDMLMRSLSIMTLPFDT